MGMQVPNPPNSADVGKIVEERLKALAEVPGARETVTVEWRGRQLSVPVISMPVQLLNYNPATHRVRAQRTLDPARDKQLEATPFADAGQAYLHQLLTGDPTDPAKPDPAFDALKEDLRQHGQNEPGIITRNGVLINGNTRRAALKELDQEHMRVGVLPADAGLDDLQSIELALQLRKDFKRDYSFMNFLLAVAERVQMGRPAIEIQRDFRIKGPTFERARWILEFIEDAIKRSEVRVSADQTVAMRLVDFETHQGKLEELYRAYIALKGKSPDEAEALREQRLIAIVLGKSKTDLRLIEADFADKYLKTLAPAGSQPTAEPVRIPGTSIVANPASPKTEALRALVTEVLKARAVDTAAAAVPKETAESASNRLKKLNSELDTALDHAGRTGRLVKRRFAAADRLADANEDLHLALDSVAEARATNNFNAEDLDEQLLELKQHLVKLAQLVGRGPQVEVEGVVWLRAVATLDSGS